MKLKTLYKITIIFLIILFCLVVGLIVYLILDTPKYKLITENPKKTLLINYTNLNEEEKEIFNNVIEDVKKMYLVNNTNIKVQKGIIEGDLLMGGVNYGDGKLIVIQYSKSENNLRNTLCHELLHTYFCDEGGNTIGHKIIYDLAEQEVCFKHKLNDN